MIPLLIRRREYVRIRHEFCKISLLYSALNGNRRFVSSKQSAENIGSYLNRSIEIESCFILFSRQCAGGCRRDRFFGHFFSSRFDLSVKCPPPETALCRYQARPAVAHRVRSFSPLRLAMLLPHRKRAVARQDRTSSSANKLPSPGRCGLSLDR